MSEATIDALQRILSKKSAIRYSWIYDRDQGRRISNVAIRIVDGELVATYDKTVETSDQRVIELVAEAEARRHERRSEAAKQAAITRSHRKKRLIYQWAEAFLRGVSLVDKPSSHCHICGKRMSDQESQKRGIGSDCWQQVLRQAEAMQRVYSKRSESDVQS
jgi:hypothetical protein